jgi:glycosyltransferase involved in cell wall biosynthesis
LRVTHIISGLGLGGAEVMLARVLAHTDRARIDPEVISMTTRGLIGEEIVGRGIPVHTLGMRRGLPTPWHLPALIRLLREKKPDVIQTWMYHADLMGGLAGRRAGRIPVVWGIRHTDLRWGSARLTTILTARLNALLSGALPAAIVCNSEASRRIHERMGYAAAKLKVIPNGFDLDAFRPDPQARAEVRRELGIPPEAILVGNVARYHPQKDHRTLVRAAALLKATIPEVHFLFVGTGVSAENAALTESIRAAGLEGCVHLLGRRTDTPRLYAAMDLFCLSSSHGESFPQVVGEAMASGVPCVVTDVGDAAEIVGETGRAVAPGRAEELAAACEGLLRLPAAERRSLGEAARARIRERYAIESVVSHFAALYERFAG